MYSWSHVLNGLSEYLPARRWINCRQYLKIPNNMGSLHRTVSCQYGAETSSLIFNLHRMFPSRQFLHILQVKMFAFGQMWSCFSITSYHQFIWQRNKAAWSNIKRSGQLLKFRKHLYEQLPSDCPNSAPSHPGTLQWASGTYGAKWKACRGCSGGPTSGSGTWRWRSRSGKLQHWLEGLQREQQGQKCQGNNLSVWVGSIELQLLEFQMELEQSRCKTTVLADEKWWL